MKYRRLYSNELHNFQLRHSHQIDKNVSNRQLSTDGYKN